MNQLGEITLVQVRDRHFSHFLIENFLIIAPAPQLISPPKYLQTFIHELSTNDQ
jgi:hypothetical protein